MLKKIEKPLTTRNKNLMMPGKDFTFCLKYFSIKGENDNNVLK